MVDLGTIFRVLESLDNNQSSSNNQKITDQNIEYMEFPVADPHRDDFRPIDSFIFVDDGQKHEYSPPEEIESSGDSVTLWFERERTLQPIIIGMTLQIYR